MAPADIPEDGDVVRIAAEGAAMLLLDPVERGDLVEQPRFAGASSRRRKPSQPRR